MIVCAHGFARSASSSEDDGCWRTRCAVCGTVYGRSAWAALPLIETLPSAGVRVHLSVAADWSIEVRRCGCGAALARRSPQRTS